MTRGEKFLGRYKSSELSERRFRTKCGGHVLVEHPTLGLVDIRTGILPTLAWPNIHFHYQETVLPMKDGLPKLKDFPASVGGSGETMPE